MILVDANLLIYAINRDEPRHKQARRWLEKALSGAEQVGLPWIVILAFLRITTRAGILSKPLDHRQAIAYVDSWLAQPFVSILHPGEQHWQIFRNLLETTGSAGNLTSDVHLAALALEYGAELYSADYDFRRFSSIRHINPIEM